MVLYTRLLEAQLNQIKAKKVPQVAAPVVVAPKTPMMYPNNNLITKGVCQSEERIKFLTF